MCSLCVRPWHDVLLVSVLKGQNVSGVRKVKGKKDVLIEQISVVLLRTEVLQQQRRYEMGTHTPFHTYIHKTHTHFLQLLINLAWLCLHCVQVQRIMSLPASRPD